MKSELVPDCARRSDLAAALLLLLAIGTFAWCSPWLIDPNYTQINTPEPSGQQHVVLGIVQDNTPVMASNGPSRIVTGLGDEADETYPDTLSVYEVLKGTEGTSQWEHTAL